MRRRCTQLERPVRPDHGLVFLLRRLGHDLELGDAGCAVAVAGADAVAAGVATADHNHMLAIGTQLIAEGVAGVDLVLLRQELHRKVDAIELATGHGQVAALLGTGGQHNRIKILAQLLGADDRAGIAGHLAARALAGQGADQGVDAKLHAFGLHLLDAAIDVALFHLEVGYAVAQQAPDAAVLLEHGHVVADACELLRCSQAGRTGANDRHFLAALVGRRLGLHPAFGPGAVDDGMLDRLDPDRIIIDVDHAGGLARRRADASGEFRKVVGAVQHRDRVLPVALVDQIVEVRNDVVDRAAAVAKRRAAIHASSRLLL